MRCQNEGCLYYYYDINTDLGPGDVCPACGAATVPFDSAVETRKSPFQNEQQVVGQILLQPVMVFAGKDMKLSKALSQTALKFYSEYNNPEIKGMKQQVLQMMAVSCFANKEYEQAYEILKPLFDEADNLELMELISGSVLDMYEPVLLMLKKTEDLYQLESRALDCCKELYGEDDSRTLERFSCLVQSGLATGRIEKEQVKDKFEEVVSWSKRVKGELKVTTQALLSAYEEAQKNLPKE